MQLPPQQVERFYRIWFPLLHYVNKQVHLTTTFLDAPRPGAISQADAMLIRNALWANDGVRESFIATNPAGLPSADLALVASWQYRIAEGFFIVRHLKKYSVFLSEGPEAKAHAYGVLGLVSPIEDIVGPVACCPAPTDYGRVFSKLILIVICNLSSLLEEPGHKWQVTGVCQAT